METIQIAWLIWTRSYLNWNHRTVKRAKVSKHRWCYFCGKLKKGAKGVRLLMGASGDNDNSFEFHQQLLEGGTDL